MDYNKTREYIEHNIVVYKKILEISDDYNQSYECQYKIVKCVTYESTCNFTYE